MSADPTDPPLPATLTNKEEPARGFEFGFGDWRSDARVCPDPFGEGRWLNISGRVVTRPIWDGVGGNLEELFLEGDGRTIEGFSLRLYRPQTQDWAVHWARSDIGVLDVPSLGGFRGGRGEFFSQVVVKDRTCLARQILSDITPDSYQYEQFLSDDGGRNWLRNWIAHVTLNSRSPSPGEPKSAETIPSHDFDFHFGDWKTHLSRKLQPLTVDDHWAEYDGTSRVTRIWGGKASLFELDVAGAHGRAQGMGVRLFNPVTREWSLNWASRTTGLVTPPPMVGTFRGGIGEFYDQEGYEGRTIFSRNRFFDITSSACKFDQAFSADGARSWEVNWKMSFERQR